MAFFQKAADQKRGESASAEAYVKEVSERIALCRGTYQSNCVGTVLYIACERDVDYFQYTDTHQLYLEKLKPLDSPVNGCIVAWQRPDTGSYAPSPPHIEVAHMGIVTSVQKQILVTNRVSAGGRFEENQELTHINPGYSDCSVHFYLPRAMDESVSYPEIRVPHKVDIDGVIGHFTGLQRDAFRAT